MAVTLARTAAQLRLLSLPAPRVAPVSPATPDQAHTGLEAPLRLAASSREQG